ncbi:MAG: AAA family ATPase [Schwartzia sp.]|nr:AAA family ATPase [Schwartzia sp. (in: firmicutes)]MBR1886430.1 AAA family ATPase [Schwartzia sp. (in: firmicutes)]
MKNKLYALVGPHASGKSTIIQELIRLGVNYIPLYTTRSPDSYVHNPVSAAKMYRFIDKADFFKQDFLVKITYKGEYYGMMKQEILSGLQNHQNSVVISDAQGIKQLSKLLKDSFESIYIMVDYVTLVERMLLLKHSNDEIKYHIEYAESNEEFDTWKVATHVVKNIISFDTTMSQILAILGLTVPISKQQEHALTGQH